jgi:WhiB family redox-sensing transcriptional regulator
MNAVNPDDNFEAIVSRLDRLVHVPDDVLVDIVSRDGSCMRLDLEPEWTGNELTDRELAVRICADCPVRDECLELELRTSGDQTLGVWGALPADDIREVYPVWRSRRRRLGGLTGDETPEAGGS